MEWPTWLPFFGFVTLHDEEAEQLDLDLRLRWSVLLVEWFGHAYVFYATSKPR